MTVCILDRPRHAQLIADVRATGARIRLITDGDVAGAISACRPGSGTDMLAGIGGTPEASSPQRRSGAWAERFKPNWHYGRGRTPQGAGRRPRRRPGADHRRSGVGENVFFCATGVTDGDLLKGVHYYPGGCTTQSIVMRSKSGTVRMIDAYHRLSKLNEYSAIDFTGDSTAAYPLP